MEPDSQNSTSELFSLPWYIRVVIPFYFLVWIFILQTQTGKAYRLNPDEPDHTDEETDNGKKKKNSKNKKKDSKESDKKNQKKEKSSEPKSETDLTNKSCHSYQYGLKIKSYVFYFSFIIALIYSIYPELPNEILSIYSPIFSPVVYLNTNYFYVLQHLGFYGMGSSLLAFHYALMSFGTSWRVGQDDNDLYVAWDEKHPQPDSMKKPQQTEQNSQQPSPQSQKQQKPKEPEKKTPIPGEHTPENHNPPKPEEICPPGFISRGFFSICRHPTYYSLFQFYFSLFLIIPNVLMLFVLVIFIVSVNSIARHEEEYLGKKFGPYYDNYLKEVKRWLVW